MLIDLPLNNHIGRRDVTAARCGRNRSTACPTFILRKRPPPRRPQSRHPIGRAVVHRVTYQNVAFALGPVERQSRSHLEPIGQRGRRSALRCARIGAAARGGFLHGLGVLGSRRANVVMSGG